MKLVPILIAILVSVALYFVVFERERLMEFAGHDAMADQPVGTAATAVVLAPLAYLPFA